MNNDFTYQLGTTLVQRNILETSTLQEALKIKESEVSNGRRNLARILVNDFKIDHHSIYREVAKLYGFKELKNSDSVLTDKRIKIIKNNMKKIPAPIRELMDQENIIIFGCQKLQQSRLFKFTFVTTDPTSEHVPKIAMAFGAQRYEVCYIPPKDYETIYENIFLSDNEFMKLVEIA